MASCNIIVLVPRHWDGKHNYNCMDNDSKDKRSPKRVLQIPLYKVGQILLDSQTSWSRIAHCKGRLIFHVLYS